MPGPNFLSISRVATKLRQGELTAERLVLSCLERIENRQEKIGAWVFVDAEGALNRARELDNEGTNRRWQGPLHGIPAGVKDTIDVAGMETRAGCEAYAPRLAETDALMVARLREAGAIILGKTTSNPLAFSDPAKTKNPWNPEFSPGGSSGGSAAAVADGMCTLALGTQTSGSLLYPASVNGVVGFKPTHGDIPLEGVLPLAPSLDHGGVVVRSVVDSFFCWALMKTPPDTTWKSTHAKFLPSLVPRMPNRVWRIRGDFEEGVSSEILDAMDAVSTLLAARGADVVETKMPFSLADFKEVHQIILAAEAAVSHGELYSERKHFYPPALAQLVEEGHAISAKIYIQALQKRQEMKETIARILFGMDFALTPATLTPALPFGSADYPLLNLPFSLIGFPALSLPVGFESGLPIGIQLVGVSEERLFSKVAWLESMLSPAITLPA